MSNTHEHDIESVQTITRRFSERVNVSIPTSPALYYTNLPSGHEVVQWSIPVPELFTQPLVLMYVAYVWDMQAGKEWRVCTNNELKVKLWLKKKKHEVRNSIIKRIIAKRVSQPNVPEELDCYTQRVYRSADDIYNKLGWYSEDSTRTSKKKWELRDRACQYETVGKASLDVIPFIDIEDASDDPPPIIRNAT